MAHKVTEAPEVIESKPGQYAILRVSAITDDWTELVAIGTKAAVEQEIQPAMVQITILGAVDATATPAPRALVDTSYLISVTKAKRH